MPPQFPELTSNQPIWNPSSGTVSRTIYDTHGFHEVWFLKLNDPTQSAALWLRFVVLVSKNGFRSVAETWALFFKRHENREVEKLALKQTYDLNQVSLSTPQSEDFFIRIGDAELNDEGSRGTVQSKGKAIHWNLKMTPAQETSFRLIPDRLRRLGWVKNQAFTVHEDLVFSGEIEVAGVKYSVAGAKGMQGHLSGPHSGHSWTWGHCNQFVNESGKAAEFVFEGLSGRARLLAQLASPQLSVFYFQYQGQEYKFNTLRDSIHCKSESGLNDWKFQAEKDDLRFVGHARAEFRDFVGVTYEDTDGSLLYCSNSKLAELEIHVYRKGKIEATFTSKGTAAFELVSRKKNPYVPLVI